jgi:hypothetical protein
VYKSLVIFKLNRWDNRKVYFYIQIKNLKQQQKNRSLWKTFSKHSLWALCSDIKSQVNLLETNYRLILHVGEGCTLSRCQVAQFCTVMHIICESTVSHAAGLVPRSLRFVDPWGGICRNKWWKHVEWLKKIHTKESFEIFSPHLSIGCALKAFHLFDSLLIFSLSGFNLCSTITGTVCILILSDYLILMFLFYYI